jgi:hypothetical protein
MGRHERTGSTLAEQPRQLTVGRPSVDALDVSVGPNAVVCLDLVLDAAGVTYRDLRTSRAGATFSVEIVDIADGQRIAAVLRQHLTLELHRATICHNGAHIQVVYEPAGSSSSGSPLLAEQHPQ